MKKIELFGALFALVVFVTVNPLASISILLLSFFPRLFELLGLANGKVIV